MSKDYFTFATANIELILTGAYFAVKGNCTNLIQNIKE